MTHKEHRLGVSEVNLVVRHLKLADWNEDALGSALREIDELFGVDDISFDSASSVLNVAYDASRLCLDGLEAVLEKHGVTIAQNWWTRFKEGYYRFVDENIAENAKHTPWSCHQTPPTARRK